MAVPKKSKPRRTGKMAVLLERSHIDDEAVLYVALEQAIISFIDLLDFDEFDIGSDAVLGAEIEHLLGLANAADGRAGEAVAPDDQIESGHREGLLRRTNHAHRPIALEQAEVGVDVVIGGNRIQDEIEAA